MRDLNWLLARCEDGIKGLPAPKGFPNDIQERFYKEAIENKKIPTLDLAEMGVTEEVADDIATKQYYLPQFDFIDSNDPNRNKLLEENKNNKVRYAEILPFPDWDGKGNVIDFLDTINKTTVYHPVNSDDKHTYALMTLYAVWNPDVRICISDGDGHDYLRWIHSYIDIRDCYDMKEFWAIDYRSTHNRETIMDVIKTDDEKIHTIDGFTIDFNKAWSKMWLVPKLFATEEGEYLNSTVLQDFLKYCEEILNEYQNTLPRKLHDVIMEVTNGST